MAATSHALMVWLPPAGSMTKLGQILKSGLLCSSKKLSCFLLEECQEGAAHSPAPERCQVLQVLDLVPMADKVTKLGGRCAYCSSKALFSLRIAADERQALVGGADKYAPVCRHHYTELSELRPSEA